jgi:peptidoglycan-N-acetylglucosamine deacetylase
MRHPIFYDPSQRRAARLSFASIILAVLSTLLVGAFLSSVMVLSDGKGPDILLNNGRAPEPIPPNLALRQELLPAAKRLIRAAKHEIPRNQTMPVAPAHKLRHSSDAPEKPLTIGFYVNWDESSYASLKKALPSLDWVMPSWLFLGGPEMTLKTDPDDKSLDLIRRTAADIQILPVIQNAVDGKWDGSGLARLLADSAKRTARLAEIVEFLDANKLGGLTVDFEAVPKEAHADLLAFLKELRAALDQHNHMKLVVSAPLDNPDWDYHGLGQVADYVLLMAYDEHYSGSKPGPIASQGWYVRAISARMHELDPKKTIIAIGNYGYDWSKPSQGDDVTFQEAMLGALDSEALIGFDPASLNPFYAYAVDGVPHRVWFLDAVTAYNQIRAADAFRPAGYALWRLGSEDPSIWSVFDHQYDAKPPSALRNIKPGNDVDFVGEGEILQIASEPKEGARSFTTDKNGVIIAAETYDALPTAYIIRRTGAAPGKVALTFDDGPDGEWTPKILDILKQKGVHATFFIVGENGEHNPQLVRRIVDEGHEIGNHTFTHPNLGETATRVTQIELNATQRLVEALTGRSMRLFRPPYFGDAEPTTSDEITALREAGNLGYVTVGLKVDPDDWRQPSAEEIVTSVMQRMADTNPETRGQVVLLHDAGGDRSQTVKALPVLIDQLRAAGREIVPIAALAGWNRDQVMPQVSGETYAPMVNLVVFQAAHWLLTGLHWLIVLAIALGLGRLAVLCGLALLGRVTARWRKVPPVDPSLSVSVLIPAYNEAKVICASVQRILESHYHKLEIIVIDDGSADATSELVRRHFANEPQVKLITIANSGKATAVNCGLDLAGGDIVVALDADTQFEPDTIAKLTRWFADPRTAAVAGNAKVGNRINTLTRWQALEYITAQNLERRALAALGCITVVPGAVGAWRRQVLVELGGFPADTLAEDQDLTMAVQKAGYRAVFDPEAVAWTEAPDTLKGLAKQRFRWAFGTLQCLWKHGGMTFRRPMRALGLIGIPQILVFQILLSLVSPFVDLMLVAQLAGAFIDHLQHGEQYDPSHLQLTLGYYALFMSIDLVAALVAFAFERNEDRGLLWWLVLQRFGYRQLMYYVVVKSVVMAAKGRLVGWSKLERKATVKPRAGVPAYDAPRPALGLGLEPIVLPPPAE